MSTDKEAETNEINDVKGDAKVGDAKVVDTPSSTEGGKVSNKYSFTNIFKGGTTSNKYFSYIFTKEFLIAVLLGQLFSFCITSTIVANEKLFELGGNFPTTTSLINYILLFIVYTPINIYKKGFRGYCEMLKTSWWKYFLLSLADVEANYFVVKAYSYTSLLSIMLLDAWSTPVVVVLSLIFLKVKYHWSQYLAVLICLAGIAAVFGGDLQTGNSGDFDTNVTNQVLGDIFCLLSGTLYAVSNVLEEYFVRQRPLYEVIGQMGFFGTIISAIQISILERQELKEATWSGPIVGCIIAYNIAMFVLYSGAPILFRIASATFFNLSLLTSDFYTLLFAIYLFHDGSKMHALFAIAFVGTMLGLAIFHIYPATKPKFNNKDDDGEQKRERDIEAN